MRTERVHEIDLFRFLAALAVVFFHYSFRGPITGTTPHIAFPYVAPIAKYGYLGVELFFMISGFVILMTAWDVDLKGFIASRVSRLFPAFWVCCTLTFLVMILMGGTRFGATLPQYLANMTMLGEFIGIQSIDGAYWSLFVEMRFYFLAAIILAFGQLRRAEGYLFAWLIISSIISFWPFSKLISYLFIVDYSAYFISGATFFLIWSKGISKLRFLLIGWSFPLATYHSLANLASVEKHNLTVMNRSIVVLIILCFFITMFLVATRCTGFLGRRSWLLVGALTYPLYLIHQNVGFITINHLTPFLGPITTISITLALVITISFIVHRYFEKSSMRWIRIKATQFLGLLEARLQGAFKGGLTK